MGRIDHADGSTGTNARRDRKGVRTVAVECDRFEYSLTGRDVE